MTHLFPTITRLALLVTGITALVEPLMAQEGSTGKKFALVVGVHRYRPDQAELGPLPFAETDATELADVLRKGGYKVTLMTQLAAKQDGSEVLAPLADYIRVQLKTLIGRPNLKDDDTLLIALAGHGISLDKTVNGEKQAQFYFCPADADIVGLQSAEEVRDKHRLVLLDELYDGLGKCPAGIKVLFVDACRNDPSRPAGRRSTSATLPKLPPPPGGIAAFFSCSPHEQAVEDRDLKHGVFFHYVIDGLKGAADTSTDKKAKDGVVTLSELHEFVAGGVYDFVSEKYKGSRQAPELKGEFRHRVPLIQLATEKLKLKIPHGISIFSACSAGERSYSIANSFPNGVESLFLGSIIEGLSGKADTNIDQSIPVDELWHYVSSKVHDKAKKLLNLEQSPEFLGNGGTKDALSGGKALIVSLSYKSTKGFHELRAAKAEAESLRDAFQKSGLTEVTVLVDDKDRPVTRLDIEKAVLKTIRDSEGVPAVVVLSGYGAQSRDNGKSYFLPTDALDRVEEAGFAIDDLKRILDEHFVPGTKRAALPKILEPKLNQRGAVLLILDCDFHDHQKLAR